MTAKQDLHRLVDELPDSAVTKAAAMLELLSEDDPVLRVFMDAPVDNGPLSPEDIAAIEEGKAEIARGELIPWEAVKARLLGPN